MDNFIYIIMVMMEPLCCPLLLNFGIFMTCVDIDVNIIPAPSSLYDLDNVYKICK